VNRDLVVRFYSEVILDGQLDHAANYLRTDYIQHNPRAGQRLSGFVAYFEKIKKSLDAQGATRRGEITMAMSDGDLVTVNVTSVITGRTSASFRAIDIFRVQDGKIAEHWDAIQPCDMRSALLLAFAG
jgi:predicted SnoaL-like aldol condensation-catalyzing enzyme